jgi:hypothetical protein
VKESSNSFLVLFVSQITYRKRNYLEEIVIKKLGAIAPSFLFSLMLEKIKNSLNLLFPQLQLEYFSLS